MVGLQVNMHFFPPARPFFDFRNRVYPSLWLYVIQNALHCHVTAIDFLGKYTARDESQNRTFL